VERTGPVPTTRLVAQKRAADRAALVAVCLGAFLVLGLLKPWDRAVPSRQPASTVLPAPSARPPAALGGPAGPLQLGVPAIAQADLGDLPPPADGWGVRAIVARPDRGSGGRPPAFDETEVDGWLVSQRWAGRAPSAPGNVFTADPARVVSTGVVMPTDGIAVAALGVTSPLAQTPLDVRLWRLRSDGPPERLAAVDLRGGAAVSGRLFRPPPEGGLPADHWRPGVYRVDLLMGSYVSRFVVVLPGPESGRLTRAVKLEMAGSDVLERLDMLPAGPFLVDASAGPLHLPALAGKALDETTAWLASAARPESGRSLSLAEYASEGVLALGLVLPAGSVPRSGSVTRLAPDRYKVPLHDAEMAGGGGLTPLGRIAWAGFGAGGDGRVWAPGSYRIDAEWLAGGKVHTGSWHLDLRPAGTPRTVAPALAALDAWQAVAGKSGIVVGTAGQAQGGPRSARLRSFAQRPGASPRAPEQLGPRCRDAALFEPGHRLIGIGHEHLGAQPSLRVSRMLTGGRERVAPAAVLSPAVPGLVAIAAPGGRAWQPGYYRVRLTYPEPVFDPDPTESFVFCVGMETASGLAVPLAAARG
jgi:hypothetical protein